MGSIKIGHIFKERFLVTGDGVYVFVRYEYDIGTNFGVFRCINVSPRPNDIYCIQFDELTFVRDSI